MQPKKLGPDWKRSGLIRKRENNKSVLHYLNIKETCKYHVENRSANYFSLPLDRLLLRFTMKNSSSLISATVTQSEPSNCVHVTAPDIIS